MQWSFLAKIGHEYKSLFSQKRCFVDVWQGSKYTSVRFIFYHFFLFSCIFCSFSFHFSFITLFSYMMKICFKSIREDSFQSFKQIYSTYDDADDFIIGGMKFYFYETFHIQYCSVELIFGYHVNPFMHNVENGRTTSQLVFTCSKLTIKTLENGVKYVQS